MSKKNLIKRITSKTLIDVVFSSKFPMTEGEILGQLNFRGYNVYNYDSEKSEERVHEGIRKKLTDLRSRGILKTSRTGRNQTASYDVTKQYLKIRNKFY